MNMWPRPGLGRGVVSGVLLAAVLWAVIIGLLALAFI